MARRKVWFLPSAYGGMISKPLACHDFVCLRVLGQPDSESMIWGFEPHQQCGSGWGLWVMQYQLEYWGAGNRSATWAVSAYVTEPPVNTLNTKAQVSVPGWHYSVCVVTHQFQGNNTFLPPWGGRITRSSAFGTFSGLCSMCFAWLISICILFL